MNKSVFKDDLEFDRLEKHLLALLRKLLAFAPFVKQ